MPARLATTDNLRDADCKSKALGEARIIRNIAGRLRYAYELATGAQATADDPRCIGVNPAGDYGCNASGPPWGATPYASHGGCGGTAPDSYFVGQKNIMPAIGDLGVANKTTHDIPLRFWMQGYERTLVDDKPAPLARLYPTLVFRCLSGTNIDVTIVAKSYNGLLRSYDATIVNTSPQAVTTNDLWFDTLPGQVVKARLLITCTSTTGVALCGYSLNCVRRLDGL